MTDWPVHAKITGPIVLIGFGSIGRGILPLIERHFDYDKSRFTVIDPVDTHREMLDIRGIAFQKAALTKDNYREVLTPLLTKGEGQGFVVNLSVDTSSLDIMKLARELNCLYVDTVVEPWTGFYFDPSLGNEERTNYALRETVLEERRRNPGGSTAVSCCGANPGMVSWFVKQALLNIAADTGLSIEEPKTRAEWGALAQKLGVKGIHIAERDTQRAKTPKPRDVFVNTWSVEGFVSEGQQPAELGWGTHEKWLPEIAGTHSVRLRRGDLSEVARRQYARAQSWTPTPGPQYGFLVTHNESISIADFLTVRDGAGHGRLSADLPLRLSSGRRRRAVAARNVRPRRQDAVELDEFWTRTRSSTASTNWACCSTATPRTPIGTARGCRSRRRASSRPIRTPPACR